MNKFYGVFEDNGAGTFYASDLCRPPKEAVEITEEDHQKYLSQEWIRGKNGKPVKAPTKERSKTETDRINAQNSLAQSDKKMARATEDLIDSLLAAGVLEKKNLPAELVSILDARKDARAKMVK